LGEALVPDNPLVGAPRLRYFIDPSLRNEGSFFSSPRDGDAGFDLKSAANYLVEVGQQIVVSTKVRLAIPPGWVGIVRERSSTGLKRLYTHSGVIDSAYRGELKILVSNGGNEPYEIFKGDKIAQLLVVPCLTSGEEVLSEGELGETARGEGGFGSTGR
jgi:dUTP pyrophosphatase